MTALRAVAAGVVFALLALGCAGGDGGQRPLTAYFASASNLFVGSEVRVLGLPVGKISQITPQGDVVKVDMLIEADRKLPAGVRAALVPVTLLGERIVQLEPAYVDGPVAPPGEAIPEERTAVPAEVDQVLRSFQSFAEALDERVLAELIDTAAETLEGQGEGLNTLIDQGADTVGVLADASDDLTSLVSELGSLNTTLATRDQKIGRTLEHLQVVMRTFATEKDDIIASVQNLRRLVAELRPLLDEHTEPLVRDLDSLTTSLSTVDRNLGRVTETYAASETLTAQFGEQVHDFRNGFVRLDNEGEELALAITDRLTARLTGVCLRLDIDECGSTGFWQSHIDQVTCIISQSCPAGGTSLAQALAGALDQLPPEGRQAFKRDARERAAEPAPAEPDAPQPPAQPEPERPELLPLPDPRLESLRSSLRLPAVGS